MKAKTNTQTVYTTHEKIILSSWSKGICYNNNTWMLVAFLWDKKLQENIDWKPVCSSGESGIKNLNRAVFLTFSKLITVAEKNLHSDVGL